MTHPDLFWQDGGSTILPRSIRRLVKRHDSFFNQTASGVAAGLILVALAAAWFWEQLYGFLAATLGVLVAPVALPLIVVLILPVLGATGLRLWQLTRAGIAGLLATEEVGGMVTIGDIAFRVRTWSDYGGYRLDADGPFCSYCSVRLASVSAGYGFSMPTCLTGGCAGTGKPPAGISMDLAERRAKDEVEAAFNDAVRHGRRPVVNPNAPFRGMRQR